MSESRPPQVPLLAPHAERGGTLVLVLSLLLLMSFLAASLLFTTDVELRGGKGWSESVQTVADADSALAELVWRFNLPAGALPAPMGSLVTVNSLVGYDARLNPDRFGLLSNNLDDNGNGVKDDSDELNFVRGWQAIVTLTTDDPSPGPPLEELDPAALLGPPWGDKLVVPTVQPQSTWRLYSVPDPTSDQVLQVRFKLDTDTPAGDAEGDGAEIVFYDAEMARDSRDDRNTLNALGGDGDASKDSPYNITYFDGTETHWAVGSPVLLVTGRARVQRAGKDSSWRNFEAELYYPVRSVMTKALCGCTFTKLQGNPTTDSFRSSEGEYSDTGTPHYANGDVGSNGNLELAGNVGGDAEAGGWVTGADSVTGDTTAGGLITGNGGGDEEANYVPAPEPCLCDAFDVVAEVDARQFTNSNGSLPSGCQGPNLTLNGGDTCTLTAGEYWYNNINIDGNGSIVIDATMENPVTIYVAGLLDIGGNGIVNLMRPGALRIIASSTGQHRFRGTADFRGVVYAPRSDIDLAGNNDNQGAFVGNNVWQHGNPEIHFDEDLASVWRVNSPYKVLNWKEVD